MELRNSRCPGCRQIQADSDSPEVWHYELESMFLQEHIRKLEAELEDKLEHLAVETSGRDALLEIEHESLEIHRYTRDVLHELLQTPQRRDHNLQCILGDQLSQATRRLMTLADGVKDTGFYDDSYWQAEEKRQMFAEMLDDWWDWLKDEAADH